MAFHHRKLHPQSVSKNTTMDCSKCCSPIFNRDKYCQFFCKTSLPGVSIPPQSPDYPPRPPRPLRPLRPPTVDTDYQSKKNHEITLNFIDTFCIFGGVFLLGCCCMVIFKFYSKWNNSRRRNAPIFDDTHEDFLDENRSPVVDHPIWFITTLGLQQSVIDSITVCKYKRDEALIEGTECSVCLNEFQDDESLRLLPKCSHAFHLPCIDTWLRSHKNCPLCRAPIVRDAAGGHVSVTEPSLNDLGSREEIWMENMENYGGLGSHQVGEGGTNEVSVGADNFGALPIEDGTISDILKKGLSYSKARSCELRVLSDLADNRRVVEEEVQPVRRSVSMDLSSASMIYLAMANVVPVEHEGSSDTQLVQVKKSNSEIVAKRRNGNLAYTN